MKLAICLVLLFALYLPINAAAEPAEFQSPDPLERGFAPRCPENAGTRELRGETIQSGEYEAMMVGTSRSDGHKCESKVVLHLKHGDTAAAFPLPISGSLDIVDFSPDRSELLLSRELPWKYPDEQFRSTLIATMSTRSGEMTWRNVWDLLGWKNCDATVEPQGFSADGLVIIRARATVMSPPRRISCVTTPTFYSLNGQGDAKVLGGTPGIQHYAKVIRWPTQTCATDPDLVGACFTVHGQLSFANGAPGVRIWWIGTKRILGVSNEILPESIAPHLSWDVSAYGDYTVCPFTKDEPGHMRFVCIDSAKNVTYK